MHDANLKNNLMLTAVQQELDANDMNATAFIAWTGRISGAIGVDCNIVDFNEISKQLMAVGEKLETKAVFHNHDDDHCCCPVIEYRIEKYYG